MHEKEAESKVAPQWQCAREPPNLGLYFLYCMVATPHERLASRRPGTRLGVSWHDGPNPLLGCARALEAQISKISEKRNASKSAGP